MIRQAEDNVTEKCKQATIFWRVTRIVTMITALTNPLD